MKSIDFGETLLRIKALKVLVLGDMMLDCYQWGKVQRISAEAPVPVIEISSVEHRLGGAANVALNLAAIGAQVTPLGVLGKDDSARIFRKLFKRHNLPADGLIEVKGRKTTLKTRIGAANQQIVRIDIEDTDDITEPVQTLLLAKLESLIPQADLLIIEDYNKGLLTSTLIHNTLTLCRQHKVLVAVDPKQQNFFNYKGVDIFKPNFSEIETNLGLKLRTDEEFFHAAESLRKKMRLKNLVVTRGAHGLYVFGSLRLHIPSYARDVYDVSGAGDTVISILASAFAASGDMSHAAICANHAAAVVCGKLGTAVATAEEILESIHDQR
ncbi:MAG TPA: D-glycero-beta-D-manno-heptose-7-phosphate kinase [Candidatus Cloacimonadota bacterium]|nr:D-glycero-beta-D-manno-heptose-7-phosphate kinase [Candidatus Cloacimonadota bacterium]